MKKLIAIFLVALAATSCMTVGRIEKNCDKFAKICMVPERTTIVIKDSLIYRTDTIFVNLPNDTVYITKEITVKDGIASMGKVHKKNGVISVDAWVKNSVLSVYSYLNDSTILVPVKDTIKVPVTTVTNDNAVVLPPVKYVPLVYKIALWTVIVQIVVFVTLLFAYSKGISQLFKKLTPGNR